MLLENEALSNGCQRCFLINGILSEQVYVEKLKVFEDSKLPNHIYRSKKALYRLRKAHRGWHERLTYVLEKKI